jgi:hypothetical protein
VLKDLDSERSIYRNNIMNYINYYNSENPSMDIIIQKKNSAYYLIRTFNKRSFTLDELNTTGNITLFSDEEKKAIAELKGTHETYKFYEQETSKEVAHSWLKTFDASDVLFDEGITTKQHASVKGWQANLDSEQYRFYHNELAQVLDLYNFQEREFFTAIREHTNYLLELLEKKVINHD